MIRNYNLRKDSCLNRTHRAVIT